MEENISGCWLEAQPPGKVRVIKNQAGSDTACLRILSNFPKKSFWVPKVILQNFVHMLCMIEDIDASNFRNLYNFKGEL